MTYSLGVDLGTTFVAAAIAHSTQIEMLTLGDRSVVTPSVVYLREDGVLVTGEAANRRAVSNPDRVGREFKRRMGDPTPVMLGGKPHAVTDLLGNLLRDVVTKVTETEGARPERVVLTHPANWGPFRRGLFEQVPNIARLSGTQTITEPEAAAAHYAASRELDDGEVVAVYDLGGGTFDATVLRNRSDGVEMLGTPEGIERLGGVDFDEAILNFVNYTSGGALSELDMRDPRTIVALARLRQDCVLAKEALSIDNETILPVFLPGRHFDVPINRSQFEDLVRAPIESTIGALARTVRSAGIGPGELSAVLLVGGSSRIPLVAEMVSEELGRPTVVDTHPKYAVALGAATLAQLGARAAANRTPALGVRNGHGGTNGKRHGGTNGHAKAAVVIDDTRPDPAPSMLAGPSPAAMPTAPPSTDPSRGGSPQPPVPFAPAASPASAPSPPSTPSPASAVSPASAPSPPSTAGPAAASAGASPSTPPPAPPPVWVPNPTGPQGFGPRVPGAPYPPAGSGTTGSSGVSWRALGIGVAVVMVLVLLFAVSPLAGVFQAVTNGPPAEQNSAATAQVAPEGPVPSVPIPSLGSSIPVGATPGFAAVSPNGRLVYVANRGAKVVTVVDTSINQVIATIPVDAGPPQYLTFAPDGRRVYLSIFNPERTIADIAVLDTTTNKIVATVPVRTRPFVSAVTLDGKYLSVPNHDSGTLSVIDTETLKVVREVKVAANPHWVEFSKDGSRAYTANHESNLISVLDTTNDSVVAEVPVGTSPHSVAVNPTRAMVANVNYDGASVSMIDTNTNQVTATVRVGKNPQEISWSPDGRFAYTANVGDGTVSVIDAEAARVTATIPTGKSPTSVAVLPNGKAAYVTNLDSGTLSILNIGG